VSDFNVPNIDLNKAATDFNHAVKEGAYVAVGLGVLGFQRAQAQRVQWTRQLESQWEELSQQFAGAGQTLDDQLEAVRDRLLDIAKVVDQQVQPARQRFDEQVDRIEERLPAGPRSVLHSWRAAAATSEQIWRHSLGLN
jgi:hypothetical protein